MTEATPLPTTSRRHDLDALRAFAMILGIVLHAALAYIPSSPWAVQDVNREPAIYMLIAGVHGFRMQLFFVLSGFFCAMLWRRRGLRGLIVHRAKRIALPLAIGMVTVIPILWGVIIGAGVVTNIQRSASEQGDPAAVAQQDLWAAAKLGDIEAMTTHLDAGAGVNDQEPASGVTALGWAVTFDHPEAVELLLQRGADPNAPYKDLNRPMHSAMFFGRADCGILLLDAGVDLTVKSGTGETPLDAIKHGKDVVGWIAGMIPVKIDFADVREGRERLREALPEGVEIPEPSEISLSSVITGAVAFLIAFPFWHHLWFLWFLCLFVATFALISWVLSKTGGIRLPRALVRAPGCFLWLIPLTVLAQALQRESGLGADTSIGLIPMPQVLFYYAIFFGFGALLYDAVGLEERLGRWWWVQLVTAFGTLAVGLGVIVDAAWTRQLAGSLGTSMNVLRIVAASLYAWTMTFGLIGLCETVLRAERAWVRYVSDSSYWLYIAHLPLVLVIQLAIRTAPINPVVKMFFVVFLTTLLLLLSYQYLVRYTIIGRLLNGPRTRPAPKTVPGA